MGIRRWLARRGAVGGTARWAANSYKFFRKRHPDRHAFSDKNVFRLMVVSRYEALSDPHALEFMLAWTEGGGGLRSLVVGVLTVEAGFKENESPVQEMFMDVIIDELERQSLPPESISGCADPNGS